MTPVSDKPAAGALPPLKQWFASLTDPRACRICALPRPCGHDNRGPIKEAVFIRRKKGKA